MQKSLKILFVINPIAGGKEKRDWETAIREFFKESPCDIDFYIQTGKDDEASTKRLINLMHPEIVAAVGGDGTIKMVAELLKGSEIRLGIIPAGSANGLAKELGIPEDVNEAIKIILTGECRKLDAIRINDKDLCFHLSDVGMNALLVKYFESSKKRGLWGYGQSLFKMLWNKKRLQVSVSTDEGEVVRKAYMVVLANAEKYGTGAIINPKGNVFDGKFEVVLVRKLHLAEIIKAVMTRKAFHPERIEVFRTRSARLQFGQKAPFQVDGEYKGKVASLEACIVPGFVNVMLPAAENSLAKI